MRMYATCYKILLDNGRAPLLAQRIVGWLRQAVDMNVDPKATAFITLGKRDPEPSPAAQRCTSSRTASCPCPKAWADRLS